jgi:hypothetical protein
MILCFIHGTQKPATPELDGVRVVVQAMGAVGVTVAPVVPPAP